MFKNRPSTVDTTSKAAMRMMFHFAVSSRDRCPARKTHNLLKRLVERRPRPNAMIYKDRPTTEHLRQVPPFCFSREEPSFCYLLTREIKNKIDQLYDIRSTRI